MKPKRMTWNTPVNIVFLFTNANNVHFISLQHPVPIYRCAKCLLSKLILLLCFSTESMLYRSHDDLNGRLSIAAHACKLVVSLWMCVLNLDMIFLKLKVNPKPMSVSMPSSTLTCYGMQKKQVQKKQGGAGRKQASKYMR